VVSGFVFHGEKRRVVVDYTMQNEILGARKFKMGTLADLAPQLRPGDALFKAELQDSYYHLRLRHCERDKLLFRIAGRWFRPLALNCGLLPAPWLFTKFLRLVVWELRRQGHRVISYMDNLSGAPRTNHGDTPAIQADSAQAGREIRELFGKPGLKLHPTKTDFRGKHALEFLGIVVDTRRQLYLLSPSKLAKISQAARLLRLKVIRHKRGCGLRDNQRFCGLGNSVYLAATDARLHLRVLLDCASAATPSRRVTRCHQSLRDLAWWGDLPMNVHVGRGIWDASPSATLLTDASMEGWGAVLHAQTGNENTPSGAAPQTRAGVHQTLGRPYPPKGSSYPRTRSPPPLTKGVARGDI
jgi:hypothetical protein